MNKRKAYLDWLRVIAIALVIYNHLPAYALCEENGTGQLFYGFLAAVTRMNVPLFLMVSGALLLNRDEDLRTLLKKRVLRFAAVIALFYTGLYLLSLLHDTILHGTAFAFSPKELIYGLFSRSLIPRVAGPYWYLYAYLGYLLMLPFLRSIARGMQKSHFMLLLVLHAAVFTVLPLTNLLLSACGAQPLTPTADFSIPLAVTHIIFYPLVGYWLEHRTDAAALSRKQLAVLIAASLAGLAGVDLLYCKTGSAGALSMFDWVAAMTVFLLVKHTTLARDPGKEAEKPSRLIRTISTCTFGIYLLDPYLKLILFGAYYKFASRLPELLSSLIWIPISIAVCSGLTWLLKKLPGFRKLL